MLRQIKYKTNKIIFINYLCIGIFYSCFFKAQTVTITSPAICKQYAIESAQLAHQSFLYAQKSYFSETFIGAKNDIDTAIIYIKASIFSIDSAIALASSVDTLAIKYAKIAKNYANDSYHSLTQANNYISIYGKRELCKIASYDAANATEDAYHSSFYFGGEKKINEQDDTLKNQLLAQEKQLTKLDIDQTVFTNLNEELKTKRDAILAEIARLTKQLALTKNLSKKNELKSKIAALELELKLLNQKNNDAKEKLANIDKQIQLRDSSSTKNSSVNVNPLNNTDTKIVDEWNKLIKLDVDLPLGLVYQIQLGVYKSEALPIVFKGLTPIFGRTTPNGISYSTGLFGRLKDAREGKDYLATMGLKDAFIVAYFDKKKITLQEALKLEKK